MIDQCLLFVGIYVDTGGQHSGGGAMEIEGVVGPGVMSLA